MEVFAEEGNSKLRLKRQVRELARQEGIFHTEGRKFTFKEVKVVLFGVNNR